MKYSDGTEELDEEEVFDNVKDAEEYGLYLVGCSQTGAEVMYMSNPGDYPIDEYDEPDFEVVEVDE